MASAKIGEKVEKPFVLGKRGEEILRAVHFYRCMTAADVRHLFFLLLR